MYGKSAMLSSEIKIVWDADGIIGGITCRMKLAAEQCAIKCKNICPMIQLMKKCVIHIMMHI